MGKSLGQQAQHADDPRDTTHKGREFELLLAIAGALEFAMVMYQYGGKTSRSLESGAPGLSDPVATCTCRSGWPPGSIFPPT